MIRSSDSDWGLQAVGDDDDKKLVLIAEDNKELAGCIDESGNSC